MLFKNCIVDHRPSTKFAYILLNGICKNRYFNESFCCISSKILKKQKIEQE